MSAVVPPSADSIAAAVRAALAEDLGTAGDITSTATIPADAQATATFGTRKAGTLAGLPFAEAAFRTVDPTVKFVATRRDGDRLVAGDVVARVAGNARAVLAAERVALNYLCHLSGV